MRNNFNSYLFILVAKINILSIRNVVSNKM